jgi:methylase of polypeptide subunit release factors
MFTYPGRTVAVDINPVALAAARANVAPERRRR